VSSVVTLPLNCNYCGGPVEAETADADDGLGALEQAWMCPYCHTLNRLIAPWRLVMVSKPGQSKARH